MSRCTVFCELLFKHINIDTTLLQWLICMVEHTSDKQGIMMEFESWVGPSFMSFIYLMFLAACFASIYINTILFEIQLKVHANIVYLPVTGTSCTTDEYNNHQMTQHFIIMIFHAVNYNFIMFHYRIKALPCQSNIT